MAELHSVKADPVAILKDRMFNGTADLGTLFLLISPQGHFLVSFWEHTL